MLRRTVALAALVALAAAATALGSQAQTTVMLRSTSLGKVLVDARGHTVYLFEADTGKKSACYGQCAAVWPPFLVGSAPRAAAGVKQALLGTSKRKDGKLQVTYRGHPLYFFAQDTKAGQVKGEGIVHFGGSWYAVSAAGAKVQPSGGTTPPPYGGTTTAPGYGGGGYGPP